MVSRRRPDTAFGVLRPSRKQFMPSPHRDVHNRLAGRMKQHQQLNNGLVVAYPDTRFAA